MKALRAEVTAKLAGVRGWLDGSDYDAALFSSQPGVAWVTAGLEDRVVRNEEPALVWALVTAAVAWLITTNIEQPRLLAEEDVAGFSVHAVPGTARAGWPGRWTTWPVGSRSARRRRRSACRSLMKRPNGWRSSAPIPRAPWKG